MGLVCMPTDVEWRRESSFWVESRHTKQIGDANNTKIVFDFFTMPTVTK